MTQTEIAKLLKMPFPKLAKACRNPESLAIVLNIAIQIGISLGREQSHESYYQMFRGYNKISIQN